MADGFSISVEGLAELQKSLDDLGTKEAQAAIRKALKAGAIVEQAAIIERAPVKVEGDGGSLPVGALKNDIVVKWSKDEQGNPMAVVTPDKYTAHVARWVEYGHRSIHGGRSSKGRDGKYRGPGKHTGDVPEHPFIRPAFEASEQEVASVMAETLKTEIEKAASRKGKS